MTDRPDHDTASILSRGERDVANRLGEGRTTAEIADARDTSDESVAKAIDRIREKTGRALTTLAESPFTADLAADLDPETRSELRDALDGADEADDGDMAHDR
jgi:hypothetical protein